MITAEVSIYLSIHDEGALLGAAMRRAIEDGLTDDEARDALQEEDGAPDVSACLRMILDPGASPDGTEILDSTTEFDAYPH